MWGAGRDDLGMATETVEPPRPRRSGLLDFASVMIMIAGVANLLTGIVALASDHHYDPDGPLFGGMSAWGIWWLLLGTLFLVAGFLIINRTPAGAIIGFTLAGINAFTQFMFVGAYPLWSIVAVAVDFLIIYALTMAVDEFD
jgi:succinate-acetate transporter protein